MEKLAIDGGTPVRTEGFGEWPVYGELERLLLLEVLESGKWGGSGKTKPGYAAKLPEAERRFAELQGAAYAVSAANGTVAITAALQAAGMKAGDEVIVPPFTFIATATAVLAFGAIPVFADIEEHTLLIDPDRVEQAITPRTKAIVAVHVAGAPANMTRLCDIAKQRGLVLIEDAAQAAGARWEGRGVGAIGDLGTFSLQSSKNLNAGEGGFIVTDHREYFEKAWSICNVGRVPGGSWYQHELIGQNYRMTEFQAAIVLAQLTRLEEQMCRREANARLLDELLGQIDGISLLTFDSRITRHACHLYIFKIAPDLGQGKDKQSFVKKMQAEGIPLHPGYVPLNRNEAVVQAVAALTGTTRIDDCPVCERVCGKEAVWLPQDVLLADEKAMHDVARAVRKVIGT